MKTNVIKLMASEVIDGMSNYDPRSESDIDDATAELFDDAIGLLEEMGIVRPKHEVEGFEWDEMVAPLWGRCERAIRELSR